MKPAGFDNVIVRDTENLRDSENDIDLQMLRVSQLGKAVAASNDYCVICAIHIPLSHHEPPTLFEKKRPVFPDRCYGRPRHPTT